MTAEKKKNYESYIQFRTILLSDGIAAAPIPRIIEIVYQEVGLGRIDSITKDSLFDELLQEYLSKYEFIAIASVNELSANNRAFLNETNMIFSITKPLGKIEIPDESKSVLARTLLQKEIDDRYSSEKPSRDFLEHLVLDCIDGVFNENELGILYREYLEMVDPQNAHKTKAIKKKLLDQIALYRLTYLQRSQDHPAIQNFPFVLDDDLFEPNSFLASLFKKIF